MRSVILRRLPNDNTHNQANQNGEPHLEPVGQLQNDNDGQRQQSNADGTAVQTAAQGINQLALGGPIISAYQVHTHDRQRHTNSSDDNRRGHILQLQIHLLHHAGGIATKQVSTTHNNRSHTQSGRCQNGASVGFVQVGTHTSHITHIVAYVVGDGGGVTRIIFWNTSFHLTNQVSANVSSLGVDATTHAGKERLRRSTHTKAQHCGRNLGQRIDRFADKFSGGNEIQNQEPNSNVQQGKANNNQTHHGTSAQSNLQAAVQAATSSISSSRGGVGGRLHTKEAAQCGEKATSQKSYWNNRILQIQQR